MAHSPIPDCCPTRPRISGVLPTDVIVLVDSTVSMASSYGAESRHSVAQWLALDMAELIPERIPAAFISLFDEASEIRQLVPLGGHDRNQLRRSVIHLNPHGDGKLDKLLNEASRLLDNKPSAVPLIVLVTDGVDCDPFNHGAPIRMIKKQFGERLYLQVIGVCDNSTISAKLRDLASQAGAGGDFTSVKSYAELPSALTRVRTMMEAIVNQRISETKWCNDALRCCFREVETLKEQNQTLLTTNHSLSVRVKELEGLNRDLQGEVNALQRENSLLRKQIESLEIEVAKLTSQVELLSKHNTELQLQVTSLTDERNSLRQEIERYKQELVDLQRQTDWYRFSFWTWLSLAFVLAAVLLIVSLLSWFQIQRFRDRLKQRTNELNASKGQLLERDEQLTCCRKHAEELHCKLHVAEEQVRVLNSENKALQDRSAELSLKLGELEESLACCKRHLEETKCRLHAAEEQIRTNAATISGLQNENTRLEVQLGCCRESEHHLRTDLSSVRSQLATIQNDLTRTQQDLNEVTQCKARLQSDLTRITGEAGSSSGQLGQLLARVNELQIANGGLQAQLIECRTGRAAAEERALGATREMAANKKDCCPPPCPPIVTGPTIGHALGGTPGGQGGGPGVGGQAGGQGGGPGVGGQTGGQGGQAGGQGGVPGVGGQAGGQGGQTGGQGGQAGGQGGQAGGQGGQAGGQGGQVGGQGGQGGQAVPGNSSDDEGGDSGLLGGIGTSIGGGDGKKGGVLSAVAPIAGTAIGTAIGGPVGGVIGGAIGSLVG